MGPSKVAPTGTTTTSSQGDAVDDVRWTDARIRWPEDDVAKNDDEEDESDDDDEEEEEDANPFDPFADPDPTEVFSFRFDVAAASADDDDRPASDESGEDPEEATSPTSTTIRLDIRGYKTGSDQVWESTGLTLWKASRYLCDYTIRRASDLRGKRVLELGAGLGLNGILAHRLGARSVVVTDGDSDAMIELRRNIASNRRRRRPPGPSSVSAAQLIWGEESARAFLERETTTIANASSDDDDEGGGSSASASSSSRFSIVLASDVVYAPQVIDPLFETVDALLVDEEEGDGRGEFWMAFAVRKVPVTIEYVLERARSHGFSHELADEHREDPAAAGDDDGGGYGIDDDPETGPVFVYVFRRDAGP